MDSAVRRSCSFSTDRMVNPAIRRFPGLLLSTARRNTTVGKRGRTDAGASRILDVYRSVRWFAAVVGKKDLDPRPDGTISWFALSEWHDNGTDVTDDGGSAQTFVPKSGSRVFVKYLLNANIRIRDVEVGGSNPLTPTSSVRLRPDRSSFSGNRTSLASLGLGWKL